MNCAKSPEFNYYVCPCCEKPLEVILRSLTEENIEFAFICPAKNIYSHEQLETFKTINGNLYENNT